ncbi:RsmB/NOP family class I SAM-dependent RNA methyltransferase [Solitalea koreensis]|uniref:16S rRNA (Cytosine967-C5)-methyltransferase n=1 Tax=Solitalea koreensis TaxID=543615 RepID=A0A521D1J2_9SPHI|nr:RsmB/NOP family class I SAM-dependent RNA methyltransferase [Solitalea koreensis]SMO65563.1 16S rRNA (cytosine967-C5)-methyltransferase [Solitalea koreensis]
MRFENQLRIAVEIINEYGFEMPLAKFLANYFRKNKQMGSKDRKTASTLLYSYFRVGKSLEGASPEDKILSGLFLCNNEPNALLAHYKPDWNDKMCLSIEEKFKFVHAAFEQFDPKQLFPFTAHLSISIDQNAFVAAQLEQPKLFIRIRKGRVNEVKERMVAEQIEFEIVNENCFSLKNATKIDHLYEGSSNKPFEVQDYSSQLTGTYFNPAKWEKWWDCCAASGGKSLMLFDQEPGIKLLVSDIRESILDNLDERFKAAGIKGYQRKELDLLKNLDPYLPGREFDGIVLDAPCSGSGTWGRTPEMISAFEESKIEWFSTLQKKIATNVAKWLKPGKPLIYITCSAFKEENEAVVEYIQTELGFQLDKMEVLKGYEHTADTMFVARLIKKEVLSSI